MVGYLTVSVALGEPVGWGAVAFALAGSAVMALIAFQGMRSRLQGDAPEPKLPSQPGDRKE
jgi:drug/metabolite transporter (DMT)-like permease